MAERSDSEQSFPRRQRLSLARDFDEIFGARRSAAGLFLVVYGRRNRHGYNRLGLVVSRRVGSAVIRNRFKRFVREAFRTLKNDQPAGWDWLVLPRLPKKGKGKSASPVSPSNWTLDEFQRELIGLMSKVARPDRGRSSPRANRGGKPDVPTSGSDVGSSPGTD